MINKIRNSNHFQFIYIEKLSLIFFILLVFTHSNNTTLFAQSSLDIVDLVDKSQINSTMLDLTGEREVTVNNETYTIDTRYSYSPEIAKATKYITERFIQMGYETENDLFPMLPYYDVKFAPNNSDIGWIISEKKIFKTMNGGDNWVLQHNNKKIIFTSIFALNDSIVYAVGMEGGLVRTVDGGVSWERLISTTTKTLDNVFFVNKNIGWICGDNGLIFSTTDSGNNWTKQESNTNSRLQDLYFITENIGWIVGDNGAILSTQNSGKTWELNTSLVPSNLNGVYFLNNDVGYITEKNHKLFKTVDGGKNWENVIISNINFIYDLDFYNDNFGVIVGQEGKILISNDGGNSWEYMPQNFNNDIFACDILNENEIKICGERLLGTIENNLSSWKPQTNNVPNGSLSNVIATKIGDKYSDEYYILCAHYDNMSSTPMVFAPGADDNASGTASVIEAARIFANQNFNYSIEFILFSGEEQGLFGSKDYVRKLKNKNINVKGVINLDMISYDSDNDGKLGIHASENENSLSLGNFVANNVSKFELNLQPSIISKGASTASDHASFWEANIPAIFIFESLDDFTPYYHKTSDQVSTTNINYHSNITKLAVGSLVELAEISSNTSVATTPQMLPNKFELHPSYPNPFNSTVNISFSLPVSSYVSIDLYNVLGEKIATIYDGMQKAGTNKIQFDSESISGNHLTSGMYIIRASSNSEVKQQKVLLLK